MAHIHNYSAGPCILPAEVLEQASQAVKSWDDHGLSLVEMSHRSKAFVKTMDECRALTKELLGLPDRFEILYLQGGASLGFLTAAMNLLPKVDKRPTPTRARGRPKLSKKPNTPATSTS